LTAFDRQDLDGVDWALFQNGWVTMYWKHEILEADCAWLADHGYQIYRLDCSRWRSAKEALRELGTGLRFPDYYGQNFNAFNDCLSDLDVAVDGGAAIVLVRYDLFSGVDRVAAQTLLDIIARNARQFMLFGRRLTALIQSDDPTVEFDRVGATSVMWNRREWLNKNRGL
jgi:RNAse (barnase) inhibitor barstar